MATYADLLFFSRIAGQQAAENLRRKGWPLTAEQAADRFGYARPGNLRDAFVAGFNETPKPQHETTNQ